MSSVIKSQIPLNKDDLVLSQQEQIASQQEEIETLKFQLAQLRKLIFGSKRERTILNENPLQGSLFGEQPKGADSTNEQEDTEQKTTTLIPRKKQNRKGVKRNSFPGHLERQEQVIYPEGLDINEVLVIGNDITEILVIQEAKLLVKKIIRPVCKVTNEQGEDQIKQAPIPARIIAKGMVDESVIAHLIDEKIQHHTPIFRQVKKMKQLGLDFIKKSTVEGWFDKGVTALLPLYHLHEQEIMKQHYLQADESSIRVLRKNKPGSTHRGQMWVANAPLINAVLFKYNPSRSTEAGMDLLDSFSGTFLQSDGYSVYDSIAKKKGLENVYCAAHARRKFKEALDKKEYPKLCEKALAFYQQLYALERSFRELGLDHNTRLEKRKKEAIPILDKFKSWLDEQIQNPEVLPNSVLGNAIAYTHKRWSGLTTYCKDGRLEIDNNLVENTIRPLALGRKNYLFAGSDHGAQNLAICYSLVNTCIKNKINPSKYLCWVLKKIANNKVDHNAINWLPHNLDKDTFNIVKI